MNYPKILLLVPDWKHVLYQRMVPHIKQTYLQLLSDLAEEYESMFPQDYISQLNWATKALRFLGQFHAKNGYHHHLISGREVIAAAMNTMSFASFADHYKDYIDSLPLDVSKGLFRCVCEVIYSIPREIRSQYNALIDWDTDSVWYQLEFFGALMVSDDAIEKHLHYKIGTPSYDSDIVYNYAKSFENEAIIVKIALLWILSFDLKPLYHTLETIYQIETGAMDMPETFKSRKLLGIQTLVRYLKDFHHLHRLLLLTPMIKFTDDQMASMERRYNSVCNHDAPLDTNKYVDEFQADLPQHMRTILKAFMKGERVTYASMKKYQDVASDMIESGLMPPPVKTIRRGDMSRFLTEEDGSPLSSAMQRMHSCVPYARLDMSDLITRLAIMRRFQLLGELFTSKHMSLIVRNLAKPLDLEIFVIVRHGATHQTQREYYKLFELLESDERKLSDLYGELSEIKQLVFDLIIKLHGQFRAFPFETTPKRGTVKWTHPLFLYYSSVCSVYNALPEGRHDATLSQRCSLSSDEVDSFLSYIDTSRLVDLSEDDVRKSLSGERAWFSRKEEKELKDAARNLSDPKDRSRKKYVEGMLKYASRITRENLLQEQTKRKELKQKAMEEVVATTHARFPNYAALHDEVIKYNKTSPLPPLAIFQFIERKIETLREVMSQLDIDVADEAGLVDAVVRSMKENFYHQDAIEYLIGQIYLSISDLYMYLHDEPDYLADFDYLLQVRNYLEHRNPILNTSEAPYRVIDETCREHVADLLHRLFYKYHDMLNRLRTKVQGYPLNYKFFEIDVAPDGHCLFAAALELMKMQGNDTGLTITELRSQVCAKISAERDTDPQPMRTFLQSLLISSLERELPPSGIPESSHLYRLIMRAKEMHQQRKVVFDVAQQKYNESLNFYSSIADDLDETSSIQMGEELLQLETEMQHAQAELDKVIPGFGRSRTVQDAYLEAMETTATWGGELELEAIASILNVTINVYHSSSTAGSVDACNQSTWQRRRVAFSNTANPGRANELFLLLVNGNHYQILQENPGFSSYAEFFEAQRTAASHMPRQSAAMRLSR